MWAQSFSEKLIREAYFPHTCTLPSTSAPAAENIVTMLIISSASNYGMINPLLLQHIKNILSAIYSNIPL